MKSVVKSIAVLSALTMAGAAWASDTNDKRSAYMDCIVEQTVRMGQNNSEPGDTVVRAAIGKCALQEIEFSQAYRMQGLDSGYIMTDDEVAIAGARSDATDRAMMRLLDARASK